MAEMTMSIQVIPPNIIPIPTIPIPVKTDRVIQCIIDGKFEKLRRLIVNKDINGLYSCSQWNDNVTLLLAAIRSKNEKICAFLLQKSADPNKPSASGWRPLHYASYSSMNILKRLLSARADPGGRVGEAVTPVQLAVQEDREDVVKELIMAGAFPDDNYALNKDIDEKLRKMISKIALKSQDFVTIKLFLDFVESVLYKMPKEVFQLYSEDLFKEHPTTHLTLVEHCLKINGRLREEYQQTCIKILKESQKLDGYIEELVKRFPRIPPAAKWNAVNSLDVLFCIVREIPLKVSLEIIPQLIECLSSGEYQKLNPAVVNVLHPAVVKLLYIISQKTVKQHEGWDSSFVLDLCRGVLPSTKAPFPRDVNILAFGILANLFSFKCVPPALSSLGVTSVPDDVLGPAEVGMDEDIKDKLRRLNAALKSLFGQTIQPEGDNSQEASNSTVTKKKKKRKKKVKQFREAEQEEASVSASLNEDLTNETLAPATEPSGSRPWHQISVRWRDQLEHLSCLSADEVYKVGNITLAANDNFRIAKGSDGTEVFLGLRDDGTEVAVKRMMRSNYEVLKNECECLRHPKLDHPHIVRYIEFMEDKYFGYLVLQLCEYTVDEYVKDHIPTGGKSTALRKIVEEVLHGLSVLHSDDVKILHRDIKPQNVLIDVIGRARLADFGISRRLKREQTTLRTASAGTQYWMARETLDEDSTTTTTSSYKRSSDIQVAGMLIYYILSGGHHPFGKRSRCEGNIVDGKYCLDEVADEVAKDLIEWMISKEPERRPTVKEALAHPYFWSPERRVEYLKNLGNEREAGNCRDVDEELLHALDQHSEGRSYHQWKAKLPSELVMKMDKSKKAYPENTLGLLRFIRNLHEHYVEEVENIDLMEIFPDLFDSMYIFAKKRGWNSRPGLKKSFQV